MFDKQLYRINDRALIRVEGPDALKFLQNLVTNDLNIVAPKLIYSALLSPQGKYLFDFFILRETVSSFLIDISSRPEESFLDRLKMYKLNSNVTFKKIVGNVGIGFYEKPKHAFFDPRCERLGWRIYFVEKDLPELSQSDFDKIRVQFGVPETDIELIKDKTYILEAGFARLSGVSFTKGCFVGQEVTARMHHKTELKKGLVKVRVFGDVDTPADIFSKGKVVGTLFTKVEDMAIAYLRFNHEKAPLQVGNTEIKLIGRY